jgi:hypothetical protein
MTPDLPIEIINKILLYRPCHPLALIIKKLNKLLLGNLVMLFDFENGVLEPRRNGERNRRIPIVIMTYCENSDIFK